MNACRTEFICFTFLLQEVYFTPPIQCFLLSARRSACLSKYNLKPTDKIVISMNNFLTKLEIELWPQQETKTKQSATAAALSAQQAPCTTLSGSSNSNSNQKRPPCRPMYSNGIHNPATAHSEDDCHKLHPEEAVAYFKAAID